jgi:hypothetical protein
MWGGQGALIGGLVGTGLGLTADASTGGLALVLNPPVIAASSVAGGAIGYGAGSALDWLTSPSQSASGNNTPAGMQCTVSGVHANSNLSPGRQRCII